MQLQELQINAFKPGIVTWIGIRPQRAGHVVVIDQVRAIEDTGLEGDHYANLGGSRQVTLIQSEHLITVAKFLGIEKIDPSQTRRNLVISGFNLLSLKGQIFSVGDAVLKYTGDCHPCSRMEANLGAGGYHAMRGLGGITAKILTGGVIRIGDSLVGVRPD